MAGATPVWAALAGISESDWTQAIEMPGAQVAVATYCPAWWPASPRLLVRRVALAPEQISADPRLRRRGHRSRADTGGCLR